MTIHAQVIKKKDRKEFVVLPYDEFIRIREALEDLEDLKELRKLKKAGKNKTSVSLKKAMELVGL